MRQQRFITREIVGAQHSRQGFENTIDLGLRRTRIERAVKM
jgi:hypothetical protein